MEKNPKCKEHNKKIKIFCPTCNSLLCINCLMPHSKKGCNHPVDLTSYATEVLFSACNTELANLDQRKDEINKSTESFIAESKDMVQSLVKIKDEMVALVSSIDAIVTMLKEETKRTIPFHESVKQLIMNEYRKIEEAISIQDMGFIIQKVTNKDFLKEFTIGKKETQIVENINQLTKSLLESKELNNLTEYLQIFLITYKRIINQSTTTIKNRFVYGICYPQGIYQRLCKYDILNKKLIPSITIPYECTVTEVNERLFISGGRVPLINVLTEYVENTKTLINKASMKYSKFYHNIEVVSKAAFIVVGGYDIGAIGYCEEYLILEDKWKVLPSLNQPRYYTATALLGDKHLYAIGGMNTNSIEQLDIVERKEWLFVELVFNELKFDSTPAAFSISEDEIMILRGANSGEAGIFDTKKKTVIKYSSLLKNDYYYQNQVKTIGSKVYTIGGRYGHIHIYDKNRKLFEDIEYASIYG